LLRNIEQNKYGLLTKYIVSWHVACVSIFNFGLRDNVSDCLIQQCIPVCYQFFNYSSRDKNMQLMMMMMMTSVMFNLLMMTIND